MKNLKKFFPFSINLLIIIHCLLFIASCGNRRSPTGGPVDTVKPEILYTSPLPFEQIENSEIVLSFSKVMDKTSVMSGLFVNPPKVSKKLVWKKNNLHINFTEKLPDDTNVVVFLNKSIKCERGNFLDDHLVFTFRNGELQDYRVSGFIIIEDEKIKGKLINATLLDKDSLLVFHRIITDENYTIEHLNSGKYTLNAFIDMNNNNRFDYTIDASFSTTLELPITYDINIAPVIADTVKPNIRTISSPFNNQILIEFNKELAHTPRISIANDSLQQVIRVIHQELIDTKWHLITSSMDTLTYTVTLSNLQDKKGNQRTTVTTEINSKGIVDNQNPTVTNITPTNGSVLRNRLPEISVSFSEILFTRDIRISLIELETSRQIRLIPYQTAGHTLNFTPAGELINFNSYQLTIHQETSDMKGNTLDDDLTIQFIIVSD